MSQDGRASLFAALRHPSAGSSVDRPGCSRPSRAAWRPCNAVDTGTPATSGGGCSPGKVMAVMDEVQRCQPHADIAVAMSAVVNFCAWHACGAAITAILQAPFQRREPGALGCGIDRPIARQYPGRNRRGKTLSGLTRGCQLSFVFVRKW